MSITQMGPVWYTDALAPNQRLVALAMADFADDIGRCWPSMQRIADKTGYSRRQASRIVKELREAGYVEIEEQATPRFSPIYQLRPETLTPTPSATERQRHDSPTFDDVLRREIHPAEEVSLTTTRGDKSAPRGDTDVPLEETPMSPKPSENHQDPSTEPSLEKETGVEVERFVDETTDMVPQPAPRPRNVGFDAVVHVFGYTPEGSEAALFGRIAAKANREDDPAAAVFDRATRMIAQWGAKTLTPAALDKWWQRFGTPLGAATEEEAARLRDDFEAAERLRRAQALDAESGLIDVAESEPASAVEMSPAEAREYVLDAVEELEEEEEPDGYRR